MRLVEAFCDAEFDPSLNVVVLTGPFFPSKNFERLNDGLKDRPRWTLHSFHPCTVTLIRHAEAVVAMAGYNTVSEILYHRKPALIVPRVSPRSEQRIRAEKLHHIGLTDVRLPKDCSEQTISDWLRIGRLHQPARKKLDFGGLERLCHWTMGSDKRDLLENLA